MPEDTPDSITEGPRPILVDRKPAALAVIVLTAVALPFVRSVWSWDGPVQECIENAGFALILIAIAGRCWASLYIGGRKARELVTRGPFSIVRNPLYFFSLVGAFGMGACSGSVTIAAAFAILALGLFHPVIRREEAALAARFGSDFAHYRATVPRLLPAPRLWHDTRTLAIEPRRVVRTLFDALPFLIALPLFEGIGALQLLDRLPVLMLLP